jgi:hypothetical protein
VQPNRPPLPASPADGHFPSLGAGSPRARRIRRYRRPGSRGPPPALLSRRPDNRDISHSHEQSPVRRKCSRHAADGAPSAQHPARTCSAGPNPHTFSMRVGILLPSRGPNCPRLRIIYPSAKPTVRAAAFGPAAATNQRERRVLPPGRVAHHAIENSSLVVSFHNSPCPSAAAWHSDGAACAARESRRQATTRQALRDE